MTKEQVIELEEVGLLDFYYVSLFSAETCVDAESCLESAKRLEELLEVLKECDFPRVEEKRKIVEDGIRICYRDYEKFKASENTV